MGSIRGESFREASCRQVSLRKGLVSIEFGLHGFDSEGIVSRGVVSTGFTPKGARFDRIRSAWVRFGRNRLETIRVERFLFGWHSFR